MAVVTTLAACNTNPALNGPDGTVDPPSFLDDSIRYALSFIAELRDGAGMPTGVFYPFYGTIAPTGYVKLNGSLVLRADYPGLLALANANGGLVTEAEWTAGAWGRFSVGDGITTMRLPDVRSMFIQGLDESRGLDVGRALGSYQAPDNQAHVHPVTDPTHSHGVNDPTHGHTTDAQGNHSHTSSQLATAGGAVNLGFTFIAASPVSGSTDGAGNHTHNVYGAYTGIGINGAGTGISIQSQGSVARPRNLAYPMIMKF